MSIHPMPATRRRFIQTAAASGLAFSLPWNRLDAGESRPADDDSFDALSRDLLRDWCDGMLAVQIHAPDDPATHGALGCPSCDFIHGRCMDAVYPFLHMAKVTGEAKYLDAGIAVFEWAKNVSLDDGSWTVIADPKSWRGITIFGAIALAEALHRHGELLDEARRDRWMERLGRAGDYVFKTFTRLDFSNINYGCTGIFGMHLLGKVLDRPEYLERSRELTAGIGAHISEPNNLLVGEGGPVLGTSPRGCRPVDLGYNVEESLVGLALTAEATGDADLTATVTRMLHSHLAFMLPDGGWDNSWGTRQAKWTYWGSRTSDGCQPGYAVFAKDHPVFATAVIENTRLMRQCTANGLLHGGPHYIGKGAKPCVHHTFTHAKALTALRDHGDLARKILPGPPLPRATADGVREYPEIATWLAARGPWRATVTATDWIYRPGVRQPTGGAISMLWHEKVGPLLAGSMPRYELVEPNNMQIHPDPGDHPLTPRVELRVGDDWFTQLFDLTATVTHSDDDGVITFEVATRLVNEAGDPPATGKSNCRLTYRIDKDSVSITVSAPGVGSANNRPRLVLPIISPAGEKLIPTGGRIDILKPNGTVLIGASAPLETQETGLPRIFNLVPGFEALEITAVVSAIGGLECKIRVGPPDMYPIEP